MSRYKTDVQDVTYVEKDIGEHDANVPPSMVVGDIEADTEHFIGSGERTKLASRGSAWIAQVTASPRNVLLKELATRLPRRGVDGDVFNIGTDNWATTEGLAK